MDYRSTIHVAFQEETFAENTRLRIKIAEAVEKVLEFHGLEGGLDVDEYKGDVEITKGWASDAPVDERGITRRAEQERLNGLIDDLEVKYSEPFERHGQGLPWNGDTECPADRDYKRLVAEDVG